MDEPQPRKLSLKFGRISAKPNRFNGQPFIENKNIPVKQILARIRCGRTDEEILTEYKSRELVQEDIDACRAWQARFSPQSLRDVFSRVNGRNVIMLDENISYKLLYATTHLFGRSSHVYAEGLCDDHNDDLHDIWAHLVRNKYAAIITADNDFKRISYEYRQMMIERYGSLEKCTEHIPAVIYVAYKDTWRETRDLLQSNADHIRRYIDTNDAICGEVSAEGFQKITFVARFKKASTPRPSSEGPPPPAAA